MPGYPVITKEEVIDHGGVCTLNVPPSGLMAYTKWGEKCIGQFHGLAIVQYHADRHYNFDIVAHDGTFTPATTKDMLDAAEQARATAETWRAQIQRPDDYATEKYHYHLKVAAIYEDLAKNHTGEENWLDL